MQKGTTQQLKLKEIRQAYPLCSPSKLHVPPLYSLRFPQPAYITNGQCLFSHKQRHVVHSRWQILQHAVTSVFSLFRKKGMILITFIMFLAAIFGGITKAVNSPECLMVSRVFVGLHSGKFVVCETCSFHECCFGPNWVFLYLKQHLLRCLSMNGTK